MIVQIRRLFIFFIIFCLFLGGASAGQKNKKPKKNKNKIVSLISLPKAMAQDNILCRYIEFNGVDTVELNDGDYSVNYEEDVTPETNPVSIKCELLEERAIDIIEIYKDGGGVYGNSVYLPSNIEVYGSNDDVTYTSIASIDVTKVNDEVLDYGIVTTRGYRWYRLDLFGCFITGATNNCALSEVGFLDFGELDEEQNIMTEDTLNDILLYETIVMFIIAIICFFVGMLKLK